MTYGQFSRASVFRQIFWRVFWHKIRVLRHKKCGCVNKRFVLIDNRDDETMMTLAKELTKAFQGMTPDAHKEAVNESCRNMMEAVQRRFGQCYDANGVKNESREVRNAFTAFNNMFKNNGVRQLTTRDPKTQRFVTYRFVRKHANSALTSAYWLRVDVNKFCDDRCKDSLDFPRNGPRPCKVNSKFQGERNTTVEEFSEQFLPRLPREYDVQMMDYDIDPEVDFHFDPEAKTVPAPPCALKFCDCCIEDEGTGQGAEKKGEEQEDDEEEEDENGSDEDESPC